MLYNNCIYNLHYPLFLKGQTHTFILSSYLYGCAAWKVYCKPKRAQVIINNDHLIKIINDLIVFGIHWLIRLSL